MPSDTDDKIVPPRTAQIIDRHLGLRLRERREALKLTQTELGQALGISCQQIQKYEGGTNRISASRLYAAADILGVSVSWFFRGYRSLKRQRSL